MEDKSRVGVCIDTCHAFAAGYDSAEKNASSAVSARHASQRCQRFGSRTTAWGKATSATIASAGSCRTAASTYSADSGNHHPDIWAEEIAWLRAQQIAEVA
ncbi:Endonuclease IV [Klebsiella pneumoniae]|nr:hypothetical protein [Klebsiella pneumoniae]BBE54728.1 Endonuclease IV [Klebsiella pneumoniae]